MRLTNIGIDISLYVLLGWNELCGTLPIVWLLILVDSQHFRYSTVGLCRVSCSVFLSLFLAVQHQECIRVLEHSVFHHAGRSIFLPELFLQ